MATPWVIKYKHPKNALKGQCSFMSKDNFHRNQRRTLLKLFAFILKRNNFMIRLKAENIKPNGNALGHQIQTPEKRPERAM